MPTVDVLTDVAEADALAPEWDALAVATGQPMSAPAWMLGWWRHAAPRGAALRVVVVRDRDELIGVLPLYAASGRSRGAGLHRLLAHPLSTSSAPVARPGREWEVVEAALPALGAMSPGLDAIALGPVPVASHWATACRERWPGRMRPLALRHGIELVPTVSLDGTFDHWLAGRSGRFRRAMRKRLHTFHDAGGAFRLSTPATRAADVEAFVRLHSARWEGRESSLTALGGGFPALLAELGGALPAPDRFRLWILEVDGEPICADLSLAAGGEVHGYNSGWDARFGRMSPPRLAFHRKIEDGFDRGDRRLSLGSGMLDFKRSFTNASDAVAWDVLVPISRRLPLTAARLAPVVVPGLAGLALRRALDADQLRRLREWCAAGRARRA